MESRPPAGRPAETVKKSQNLQIPGRKIATKGTQEGFLSFSITVFSNFFKVEKICAVCRKDFSTGCAGHPPGGLLFSSYAWGISLPRR